MSGLAHYFEAAGIPTTLISLIRLHTEKMRPPRALWVPFELGRPFGPPGDSAFQTRVLERVLGLLEASQGPVLIDYPEDLPAAAPQDEAWVCPVQFRAPPGDDSLLDAVRNEMRALEPWYQRAVAARGRTTVGVSGLSLTDALALLSAPLGEQVASAAPSADALRLAAEDLKAFYTEAVTAQPGHHASRDVLHWFWHDTAASALLRALQARFADSEDPALRLLGNLLLVPRAQA